jgi:hypothetical protein
MAVGQETWEATTDGTTWVQVKDPRVAGGWRGQKVGGKSRKKLNISVEEREFNQELIPEENAHHDPFQNGLLVRIHPKAVEDRGVNELDDEQLKEILAVDDDDLFEATVEAIDSEVIVRRLAELGKKGTTYARLQVILDIIEKRYSVGKTSRVVQEAMEDDAKYIGADF